MNGIVEDFWTWEKALNKRNVLASAIDVYWIMIDVLMDSGVHREGAKGIMILTISAITVSFGPDEMTTLRGSKRPAPTYRTREHAYETTP